MVNLIAPSCEDLWEENEFEEVDTIIVDEWRWGNVYETIYRDRRIPEDQPPVYWAASYRRSTDGETHELREGDAVIYRVRPVEKTVTTWVFGDD